MNSGERIARTHPPFRTELRHLATKADLADLRTELKAEMADLRTDMQAIENRLTLRLGGLIIAGLAAVAAIMRLLA